MRVGVIGTGHLGREHARVYSALPGVRLVGVHDAEPEVAARIAADRGVPALPFAALLDGIEAVSVCVPTPAHAEAATACLEPGLHGLVEKPITDDLEPARNLVPPPPRCDRTLQVGHVERFNPAMVAAARHLERPRFVESHRLSPFGRRGADVAVVLDLMIHDLDLVLSLVGEPVERIDASGVAVLSGSTDIASARLRFRGGCVANLTASRISLERMRKIRFFQPDSYVSVDLLAGQIAMYRKRAGFSTDDFQEALRRGEDPDPLAAIEPVPITVVQEEPLRLELQAFVDCVR